MVTWLEAYVTALLPWVTVRDAAGVAVFADAAVVGSAIVERMAAGASVEDVIALLGAQRRSDEARARRIMTLQPDLVCVAGGTDGVRM